MIRLSDALLTDGVPRALAAQPWAQAIAYAYGRQAARALEALPHTHGWSGLADAPDAALDMLAAELHAPGYEQTLSPSSKRDILRGAFDYWAHAGTVASVENVLLSTFGSRSQIEDWYMYEDGQPGYFRITTDDPSLAGDALTRFKQLVGDVKRLSAWLDEVAVNVVLPETALSVGQVMLRDARVAMETERLPSDLRAPEATLYYGALLSHEPHLTLTAPQA